MSTSFPTNLDTSATIPVEGAAIPLSTNHVTTHQNIQDAIEAIEAKVGADSSAVTTSHDYKLSEVTDKAAGKTATQTLTNKTLTSPVINVGSDATGDMYYRNAGVLTRIPVGTDNQIMKLNGTTPNWEAETTTVDASTTVKGIVEAATSAEVTAGTATGGTGAVLAVTPDALAASTPVFNGSALTNLPASVYYATASNNLKLSADTERSKATSGLTLIKSIRPSFGGVVRITHDMKGNSGSSQVESRIYLNGVATGTSRTYTGTTYQSYSEDITINPGDQVQLYYAGDTGFGVSCFVRNFRLSFDTTSAGNGYTITD